MTADISPKSRNIQRCETNDAGVYVTVVIDNTMIEADEYTLEMRASETDSMLLKAENLLEK